MRLAWAVALLALVCGCGTDEGSATNPDAANQPDAGVDRSGSGDASDAPSNTDGLSDDLGRDGTADGVGLDVANDAGPFSCGVGLTCQASQYCVPQCCGGCLPTDGGVCPAGATTCQVGGGIMGCAFCTSASCTSTIPFGCIAGGAGDPRRLYCTCD